MKGVIDRLHRGGKRAPAPLPSQYAAVLVLFVIVATSVGLLEAVGFVVFLFLVILPFWFIDRWMRGR